MAMSHPPTQQQQSGRFFIFGSELQVVQVLLSPGDTVRAEPGTCCYHSANVGVDTVSSSNGILQQLTRFLAGESPFVNVYKNNGPGEAYVGISASHPGKIVPLELAEVGPIMCHSDVFMCSIGEVSAHVRSELPSHYFLRHCPSCLPACVPETYHTFPCHACVCLSVQPGDRPGLMQEDLSMGLRWRRLEGTGIAFLHGGGTVIEKTLSRGETLLIDSSCVVAFSIQCEVELVYVGNLKSALFGNAALFNTKLTGPGRVMIQSLPMSRVSGRVIHHLSAARGRGRGVHGTCLRLLGVMIILFTLALTLLVSVHMMLDDNEL